MTSLANADGGVTSTDEFWRVVDKKNRAIGKQRIGSLNKLFAHRYGGREAYVFPDDDAGVEDLKILLQHYRLNNPLRMPGIIQLRAPWVGDPAGLIEQIEAYPRKWRAETLGRELNFTGAEWKLLRLRTIAPIDMTHEGRRAYSQKLYLKRRRIKLRQAHRADYLAENNLSRTKPWVAEGICRRTWERRRAMAKPPRGMSQVSCNKVSNGATHLRQQGWRVESEEGVGEQGYGSSRSEAPVLAMVESSALSHARSRIAAPHDADIMPGGIRDRAMRAVLQRIGMAA